MIIIEKNKIRRDGTGLDIFGSSPIAQNNGLEIETKRGIDGRLEFGIRRRHATLEKDVLQQWIYKDSDNNLFEFSPNLGKIN